MNSTPPTDPTTALPITAVERETGITKDTLRVWEKRYGFPQPLRDESDERRYPVAQIQKLKRIRRLIDAGHRPGKVVSLSDAELSDLLDKQPDLSKTKKSGALGNTLDVYLECIAQHSEADLRHELQHALLSKGVSAFVHDVVAPLTRAVGEAWAQGRFEIFEEHLYTEVITNVLRSNLVMMHHSAYQKAPKVLLTTVPQELHGLGLLMVESLLAIEACCCISLGTQTPLGDIVHAAQAYQADVVALSFSNVHSPTYVLNCLRDLRQMLPESVEIWVGGGCSVLYQKPLPGIIAMEDLHGLTKLISRWRTKS